MDNLCDGWLDWQHDGNEQLNGNTTALAMDNLHDGHLGDGWTTLQ